MTLKRIHNVHSNRYFWELTIWRLALSSSLEASWRLEPDGNHWTTKFGGIRCTLCGCLTAGCRKHWFCGVCEACRPLDEESA